MSGPTGWVVGNESTAARLVLWWFEDGKPWAKATIGWDGCVDYERAHDVPFPEATGTNVDKMHICNPLEVAAHLQDLAEISRVHFGGSRN